MHAYEVVLLSFFYEIFIVIELKCQGIDGQPETCKLEMNSFFNCVQLLAYWMPSLE